MKMITTTIEGIRPLIMHNGQTADPLNPYAKAMKKLSGKRNKTEDDHAALGCLEFEAGLYWSEEIGLHIPSENLFTMFQEACKKVKLGRQSIAVLVDHEIGAVLDVPNHKNIDAIKADQSLKFRKVVKVGQSKVCRVRPRFKSGWKLSFDVLLDTDLLDADQFEQVMHIAGNVIGLGDWRPSSPKPGTYGRFDVKSVEAVDV